MAKSKTIENEGKVAYNTLIVCNIMSDMADGRDRLRSAVAWRELDERRLPVVDSCLFIIFGHPLYELFSYLSGLNISVNTAY
jgi:hypothetical protein